MNLAFTMKLPILLLFPVLTKLKQHQNHVLHLTVDTIIRSKRKKRTKRNGSSNQRAKKKEMPYILSCVYDAKTFELPRSLFS